MRRALVLVVLSGLALRGAAAQEAQSGARVGQVLPGPFRVFVVTGPTAPPSAEGLLPEERQNLGDPGRVGKFHDFVTNYGLDPVVAVFSHAPPPAPEQPSLWRLRDQALSTEGNLPSPAPVEDLVPSDPPLHAFGAPPASLLN